MTDDWSWKDVPGFEDTRERRTAKGYRAVRRHHVTHWLTRYATTAEVQAMLARIPEGADENDALAAEICREVLHRQRKG